jgi:YcaO-like protein with predicted kinase domain
VVVNDGYGRAMALANPPGAAQTIVTRTGAYRTATAEQTRQRVEPMLPIFGISRVADVTRLDEIGLPTHVAYRPCSKTLCVSVGTGLEEAQSWVSAVMESIETWHAENDRLTIVERGPARALDIGYDIRDLNLAPRSPVTDMTVLDWVAGTGLISGRPYLVPIEIIRLDFTARLAWEHVLFQCSSNGLATGNTPVEATLHALLEVVERDCATPYTTMPLDQRRYTDPATASHPAAVAVLAALAEAGCWIEVCEITNGLGIPAYASSIWSQEIPVLFGGFGCHPDAEVAMTRALMEAAQSRLTAVSGARDDIDKAEYEAADVSKAPPPVQRLLEPVRGSVGPRDDIDAVLRFCAQRVLDATGSEPFVVDMTRADIGIPASKVITPGMRLYTERELSRRPGEHHV